MEIIELKQYITNFDTVAEFETFSATTDYAEPHVSFIKNDNDVIYMPIPPETRVVAKYNVTSTSSPTQIGPNYGYEVGFSAIEIDGVAQPSVVTAYTFDTLGEHTVKYTLTDPTTLDAGAFYGCRRLTNIIMPNNVTSISGSAFATCSSLTSINIPSGVTSISSAVFSGCTSLTSIDIPNSVTTIDRYAFATCSSLTSINIPSGVTTIGDSVFHECRSLTSINIPSGVTSIGYDAFYNCSGLTSIEIPSGVTSIGNLAFYNCSSLTSITSNATTAPTIQSSTFQNVGLTGTLYVPSGSSGYDTWMGTSNYYLGKYFWTKVEQ